MPRDTRRLILDTALRLFATGGYHGTSMRVIAREAGISPGLSYKYFESKEAILREIMREHAGILQAMPPPASLVHASLSEIVRTIAHTFSGLVRDNKEYFRLFWNLMLQAEVSAGPRDEIKDMLKAFRANTEEVMSLVRPDYSPARVNGIMSTVLGFTINYLIDEEQFPLTDLEDYLLWELARERAGDGD